MRQHVHVKLLLGWLLLVGLAAVAAADVTMPNAIQLRPWEIECQRPPVQRDYHRVTP